MIGTPSATEDLLQSCLQPLINGLAALIRPGIGLWDPVQDAPTPSDHYGQLAAAFALRLEQPSANWQEAERAWFRVPTRALGHAPFNRFILLLSSRLETHPGASESADYPPSAALKRCPLRRHYPSNNWALLAQLCRLLEAKDEREQQQANDCMQRLLARWMTLQGGFIDYPANPVQGRPIATPMAYHHKALFVATVAAWYTEDQRWATVIEKLLQWTLLSWDGLDCVGGFGRSNHALFGDACLLAALVLIGLAEEPRDHKSPYQQMLTGILRRWQRQQRVDGLLWLNPAGSADHPRAGWDAYMYLTVYNAWAAAILAWARQTTKTMKRPPVLRNLTIPSEVAGILQDPEAGLLRFNSTQGLIALVATRGQVPQAIGRSEVEFRYCGGQPFHIVAHHRCLMPPPARVPIHTVLQHPASAGWVPVFQAHQRLYGLTQFDIVEINDSDDRLEIHLAGQPIALVRESPKGVLGRLMAAIDWRLLGGRLGRRQALNRSILFDVRGTLSLQFDRRKWTLAYRLALDNDHPVSVTYLNPCGHALIASAFPVERHLLAAETPITEVEATTLRSAALAVGIGYCSPSAPLPPGRSVYSTELRWSPDLRAQDVDKTSPNTRAA